jgi:BirA family transcriptional regulator, biotin operon repressor / biotin---[acetyl-CoA-carboxylase] ligase
MERLISLLADGEFHAGNEMGALLGVSRAAVWKQVQKLQELGLDVQSVKGKGYRLSQPLELLNSDYIKAALDPSASRLLRSLDIHSQTSSTNDVAMSMAVSGAGSGSICMAEQQTAGRGRRGRQWISPFGVNIYLSCVWEFFSGAAALEGLSLATGVAVADALQALGVEGVSLKWPNDVLLSESKLAGILLEMTGDPAGRCQVVLGIGINHRMQPTFATAIEQKWTRVEDVCPGISRNILAATTISKLLLMLQRFQVEGFAPFRPRWQALDAYRGKNVVIKTGAADDIEGVADGVDGSGGLRVLTPDGLQIMKGGEVSLRLQV